MWRFSLLDKTSSEGGITKIKFKLISLSVPQNALKSASDKIIVQHLTVSDRCLAWLSYIHLIEFGDLPVKFYDPANSNSSKLMKKESFLIPWKTMEDVKANPDTLLALFEGNWFNS